MGTLWYEEEHGTARVAAPMGEAALNTLGYFLSRYGALTGTDLEHLTHSEHPWRDAYANRTPTRKSVPIPSESIAAYIRRAEADEGDQDALPPDADGVAECLRTPANEADPASLTPLRRSGLACRSVPERAQLWSLKDFTDRLDVWARDQNPDADLRLVVTAWILSRFDDPYHGVRRQLGFPNLWFGTVPGSRQGDSVVTCAY